MTLKLILIIAVIVLAIIVILLLLIIRELGKVGGEIMKSIIKDFIR